MDTLRDNIHADIEETKEHCEYVTDNSRSQVEQVIRFIEGMTQMHREALEEGQKDIIE